MCPIEEYALGACIRGSVPDMPDALDRLCDAGWIDNQAAATAAGIAAWEANAALLRDAALMRNVLPSVSPEALVALGRLAAGDKLQSGDIPAIDHRDNLADWSREEQRWVITAQGRRVVELSHMRTY